MNEKLKKYLLSIGLAANATDTQALEFLAGLEGDQRTIAQALNVVALEGGEEVSVAVRDLVGMATMYNKGTDFIARYLHDPAGARAEIRRDQERDNKPVIVGVRDNARDGLSEALSDGMARRAGTNLYRMDPSGKALLDVDRKPVRREAGQRAVAFSRLPGRELAKAYLRAIGYPGADELGAEAAWSAAFNPRTVGLVQGTDSFPLILANAANKGLLAAYIEAPRIWDKIAARDTTPDFKTNRRAGLGAVPDLIERQEGGEYKYLTITETGELFALAEYTAALLITRRGILNDDLGVLNVLPRLEANAARRKEDLVTLAVLTANALMADGYAIFSTEHANQAAVGAALGITTLDAGFQALAKQKAPTPAGEVSNAYLNLVPNILLVPSALRVTALQYTNSGAFVPTQASNSNPFAGLLEVLSHPMLDNNSSTAWYLLASPRQFESIVVMFLEGEESPVLKSEIRFETDDLAIAVRHSVAAKALDYRGLYKNAGA